MSCFFRIFEHEDPNVNTLAAIGETELIESGEYASRRYHSFREMGEDIMHDNDDPAFKLFEAKGFSKSWDHALRNRMDAKNLLRVLAYIKLDLDLPDEFLPVSDGPYHDCCIDMSWTLRYEHEEGSDHVLLIEIVPNDPLRDIPEYIDVTLRVPLREYEAFEAYCVDHRIAPRDFLIDAYHDAIEQDEEDLEYCREIIRRYESTDRKTTQEEVSELFSERDG